MDQLFGFWNGMTVQRRIISAAATIGVFTLVLFMARVASTPNMSLLYSGLDPTSAGEVVNALEANASVYEVRGNSIYVETQARDQLRMTLASQGLPASGTSGYEILEQMTGFGTTSQMFDAAYWRAKEGELARTIAGSSGIKAARVHIANAGSSPFQRSDNATASVTLQTSQGMPNAERARAIQFLVASAVTGLAPEDVTVIDQNTGRIISSAPDATISTDTEGRAAALQERVGRLLAARVGKNHFVVEVSVEAVREEETLIQRTLDPASRVIISTDSEETSNQNNNSGQQGAVTVASNLPTGDAGNGSGSSSSQNASTRERVNYDISATEREIKRAPGAIKRLTVAVLIDGTSTEAEDGTITWEARPEQELEALRELVQSAVGYDAARGDIVTIQSLQFDPSMEPAPLGQMAGDAAFLERLDIQTLSQLLILGVVAVALGMFVVRPVLKANVASPTQPLALSNGPREQSAAAPSPDTSENPALPALTGTIEDGEAPFALPAMGTASDFSLADAGQDPTFELPDLPAFNMATPGSEDDDTDPVERLRQLIEGRREETVEILRGWMEEDQEKA